MLVALIGPLSLCLMGVWLGEDGTKRYKRHIFRRDWTKSSYFNKWFIIISSKHDLGGVEIPTNMYSRSS